jgi:hypothetical protein
MFITQTGLTYFYKWPITFEIQILNLIKCRSGICNRCDLSLENSLWNQGKSFANFKSFLRKKAKELLKEGSKGAEVNEGKFVLNIDVLFAL